MFPLLILNDLYALLPSQRALRRMELPRLEAEPQLSLSSRTDRGVHALRNTCHVDITRVDKRTGVREIARQQSSKDLQNEG